MRIDYEDLCNADKRPLLIDARDPSRFAGADEPGGVTAGHIPGSINKFYQQVIGADGLLLDAEALREYWCWLEEEEEAPVFSCGSGITACVNLLSLEVAGLQGARLYPGSWSDWCQRGGEVATGGH
jgi:thiosulfate/3-mercaptopyruvate sulfurtransferase